MGPARELTRVVAGVAVIVLAALLAGCASGVIGTPTASTVSTVSSSAPTTTSSSALSTAHACAVTTDGTGISLSGDEISWEVDDSGVRFSCGGPTLALGRITSKAVTLDLSGASVTVAVGTTGTVGPYQVTVLDISRGTAQLQITKS